MRKIKVGSDFSGVGAFNQALIRLGIDYEELFACDMDKYARQTFSLNFGEPKYFPKDVYEREIPNESLDIYMTSPPCQAFSLAGKRLGKEDKRGILFFNSLEFIQENKPRYFIFENVKGLLSHDKVEKTAEYGRTFQEWINYLGGKSINGVHTFFPYEDSVPYHIYFQVLNAKHYGIPQNRERIFIVGIRDDKDNDFQFPRPFPLTKRLKDVLESEVDEKYFLSDKMVSVLAKHQNKIIQGETPDESGCLHAGYFKMGGRDQQYIKNKVQIGTWRTHEDGKGFRETEDNNCPTIPARAREDGSGQPVIKILGYSRDEKGKVVSRHEKDCAGTIHTASGGGGNTDQFVTIATNNSKGFDIAEEEEDSINFSVPTSETRRGRVGKGVSQTLDTQCNQGIATRKLSKQELENPTVIQKTRNDCYTEKNDGTVGCLQAGGQSVGDKVPNVILKQRIRRLTPTEAFRLMDFNEDFIEKTINSGLISDSQLYKQAGNSICVGVLAAIISKLKL